MTRRLPLRENHAAFQELRNYQNTLANAFQFLYSDRIEFKPANGLDACKTVITDTCREASKKGLSYLTILRDPMASDSEIRDAFSAFSHATDNAVKQMQTLATTTHTAQREDEGTTFTFHYLTPNGKAGSAEVMVRVNSQDFYDGLSYLRNNVWQNALQGDLDRLQKSIGDQYLPRNFQAGRAA